MGHKQVKDRDELYRDLNSKAIINVDDTAYERRKAQKAAVKLRDRERLNDKNRISDLESEMSEMRQMMQSLLAKTK